MTMLNTIIERIEEKNSRHGKKLRANLTGLSDEFYSEADQFFKSYESFADEVGKDLEFGIESYLKVVSDTLMEQIRFMQTGEYSCKSFDDAYERVYNNPEVMEYYMHGLLMTQFLWAHHFDILKFFRSSLSGIDKEVKKYLEIGGGHGLYLEEAIRIFGARNEYHMVDISKSSLEMAKSFVKSSDVKFMLQDIYEYDVDIKYDFITMGEVLEHVEKPVELMQQIHRLLSDDGYSYITAPANAPAIDHISLFESSDDIRKIFTKAGFTVVDDISIYTEDTKKAERLGLKVPMMYGALIKKA